MTFGLQDNGTNSFAHVEDNLCCTKCIISKGTEKKTLQQVQNKIWGFDYTGGGGGGVMQVQQ